MARVMCKCPDKGHGNWYIGRKCLDCKTEIRAYRYSNGEYRMLPLRGCRKCGERYPFGKRY
jgi:hypothetical protein